MPDAAGGKAEPGAVFAAPAAINLLATLSPTQLLASGPDGIVRVLDAVVTNIALELPILFTGAIVTETIFSWPGMGRAYIDAVAEFDYTVLMGILVITALIVVVANFLADVIYAIVDPRISYG